MVTYLKTGLAAAPPPTRCGARRRFAPPPAASARERLLAAGLRLISKEGYHGATTRRIAEAAGVSELTLFRHFRTKGGLFEEVLRQRSFLPRLRNLVADVEGLPAGEGLRRIGVR